MNINRLTIFSRLILFGVTIVALPAAMRSGESVANAKLALRGSQVDILDSQIPGNHFGETTIAVALDSMPSISDSCGGPVIYLSGVTTSRYSNNTVADGTTFNRTGWYSDAVGNGESTAFSVGNGVPPPYDVCVFGGVINGHIPLSWSWEEAHDFGGSGDRTYTAHLAQIDGARIHNVEDGWKPRELPEFGNTGIMQMRNTYMTGIRDDAIEDDNFMPGLIEDSLFDGVRTFLSEQNQSGGTPSTLGPNEDPYIRITRVYVRLYPTNSDGNSNPGSWFKWKPNGTINHNLIITDSVFATPGPLPGSSWSVPDFPPGTIFEGTNYILWLGIPGEYDETIPPGVTFLEGQTAVDKWNQVRSTWLTAHGYDPRPLDDFNPMDDPVLAPVNVSITGNVGVGGATLSYTDGMVRTVTADGSGNYTIIVPSGRSGMVTPYKTGYTFTPVNKSYSNTQSNQTLQNYTATPTTPEDVTVYRRGVGGSYFLFYNYATASFDHLVSVGNGGTSASCYPAALDVNGDGKDEISHLCGGGWHFFNADGSFVKSIFAYMTTGDRPAPGEYDGN